MMLFLAHPVNQDDLQTGTAIGCRASREY